jgi:hypothetical protein
LLHHQAQVKRGHDPDAVRPQIMNIPSQPAFSSLNLITERFPQQESTFADLINSDFRQVRSFMQTQHEAEMQEFRRMVRRSIVLSPFDALVDC